jgi:glycosyltransferase involved in cell wall biosynthesis
MSRLFEALLAALPRLERVVTSCQLSRHSLIQAGLPDEQIAIIPIGVDLTKFSPPSPAQRGAARAKYGVPEDAFCIGSFQKDGNGWEEGETPKLIKGPDVFLECIAQLARRYPNLYVLLTGPARGYVKAGLQKIGVRYGHSFFEDYYQVAECYHALDAYLITSRNEGGPKALMESWATTTPLVSTKVGMCADWMRSGQNGVLAEVEDVNGLVEGICALWEDSALRTRCTQQGLADVPALDWSSLVTLYYQLYQPYLK